MHLCQTTQGAARHAAEKDFVRSEALEAVEKAQREDKERDVQWLARKNILMFQGINLYLIVNVCSVLLDNASSTFR